VERQGRVSRPLFPCFPRPAAPPSPLRRCIATRHLVLHVRSRRRCRKYSKITICCTRFYTYIYYCIVVPIARTYADLRKFWVSLHRNQVAQVAQAPQAACANFYLPVVSDFTADILLTAAPLTMLWQVKLPTKERRLILALFSCNLFSLLSFTTFVLIWYFVIDLGPDTIIFSSMFGLVQVSCSKLHRWDGEISNFSQLLGSHQSDNL